MKARLARSELKLLVREMVQKLQGIAQEVAEGMVQEVVQGMVQETLLPAWEVAHPGAQEMGH